MLPSKGYFSAIPCVFYLAGNCERPHCHYRHCARDKTNNSNDELDNPSEAVEERNWLGSNLSESFVTEMVEKAVDKVFVEDPKRAETLNRDHIIKTALDKLKQETITKKGNVTQKGQPSSIGFPSYKPTPIAELNKRHIPVMYAPERPLSAIRKDKCPDEKSQMISSLCFSDSFKQKDKPRQGLKFISNSSADPNPIQGSVTDENSLDTKDEISFDAFSEILDSQTDMEYSSIVEKINVTDSYNMPSAPSIPSSEMVANTVGALCDNIFTEFGINSLMAEHSLSREKQLFESENSLSKNEEKIPELTDTVLCSNSNTSLESIKMEVKIEEKNDIKDGIINKNDSHDGNEHPNQSHKQIAEDEKKSSCKDDSKPHHAKKSEKSIISEVDKHRNQKSHDSISKQKHERTSSCPSKDKHRMKDKEKNEEHNRKSKCKGNGTDKAMKPSLPLDQSKKSVNHSKDSSKRTKIEKASDKKYSKSNEKCDKKERDKHNEKQKDDKKNHGSKSNCDLTKKLSSSKSPKHSSDHHKDKSHIKSSSIKAVSSSSSHHYDDVSKTRKRKVEQELLQPEKRMKVSSKNNPEGHSKNIPTNNYSAEIDIFSDSNRKGSIGFSAPSAFSNDNDNSHAGYLDDSGSDDMDVDSVIYSPTNPDIDAISISSGDSTMHEETQDDWKVVKHKRSVKKYGEESLNRSKPDSLSSVFDKRWTIAKEIIQRNSNSKIRIAHVPNVSNILSAKTRLLSKTPEETVTTYTSKTSAKTDTEDAPLPKVVKRIAHGAQGFNNQFPTLIHSQEIKVNASIRQHFCNIFYDELGKFLSPEDARKKAAAEEFEVAKKCSLPKIYRNNCTLLLLKIRKSKGKLSKDETAAEKLESTSTPEYTYGWSLYKCFERYVMTDEELIQHGYPMPLPGQSNCAYIEKSARRYYVQQPDKPFTRKCVNCGKLYEIAEDGMPTSSNDCFYHWGRLRRIPGRGQLAEKFTCCDGADDATPCQSSTYHVWSGRNEDCMPGFVKTKEFPSSRDESCAGILALDCEMCYTTRGLELARLTVVDLNEDVIFDEVVALDCPVLDYCTRFSGIDESKVRLATYSFDDVQQWVLDNVYDKTILVGHSLENDLKVLKVFHKRVVDTSVTFPHKFGFPQKCSLKFLARSILSMTIQESEDGHDSKEDAVTCLKLIMTKIKEDSKIRKPRVIIGFSGKKR